MNARYDRVAGSYSYRPDDYDQPAVAGLLDRLTEVRGADVLDLACGHGLVARELARRGCSVTGLDISPALLEKARAAEVEAPLGITYELGDASDPTVLAGRTFDVVVSNFGLSDIDDLDGAFATVDAALRPHGRFVFSILHPCFAGSGSVSGSWPTGSTYYDERWWQADGEASTLRREVGSNHRTLSTYFNTAVRHGLSVHHVDEPRPEREWTTTRPDAAVQPVYLVVECRASVGVPAQS